MTIHSHLTPADYRAFHRHVMFRYRKVQWLYGVMLTLILLLTWKGIPKEASVTEKVFQMIAALIIFATVFLLLFLLLRIIRLFTGARFAGSLGEHVFEISDDGVTESNSNGRTEMRINGIKSIDETATYFFVISKTGVGCVIPKRDLASHDAIKSLQSRLAGMLGK